jgi:hypothetical protein
MKTGSGTIRSDGDRRQHRSPCPMLLVIFVAAAATALYYVHKLTAVPRLQVCDARLGPYVYDRLNNTIQDLKLNITLCWK